ncbi:MAG: nitrate- and nitrite sensing domain-containing protein [Actinomycetota bacterium]|nr:nitrate- and nitrite sensing domain-containing protein [Actinomycetota bacterium]
MRSRLVVLLVIPLVLAGVLGGLRVASSVGEIQVLGAVQRQVALVERVATVIESLQTERHLAAAAAATGAGEQRVRLEEQIQQVDADVAEMRDLEATPDGLADAPGSAYGDALRRIDTLEVVRERAAVPGTAVDVVISRYREVIAALLRFNRTALAGTAADSDDLATGISYLAEAKEQLSVQHAVLLAASLGNLMTSVQESQLRSTEAAFDSAIRNFSESVPSAERQVYFSTYRGAAVSNRERLLLIGLGEWPTFIALETIAEEWDQTASAVGDMLLQVESSLSDDLQARTAEASDTAVTTAIRDASIVALLLLFTLIVLVLVARSVLGPLSALRTSALDVAQRRLPALVERLRRPGGWKDDVAPEPMAVHTGEDIGQVARAFDEVHREAVRLATEQAMMRSTVNDMFVNLSRRSQSMVERQLRIIDSLESGERDPEALGELFRLDHLATRMRRNNENLLVLAGSETRQRAGRPRSVLDILRGAISEIEEYQRITIESVPDAAVEGIAVNDLVHLTAELLDNATNFSPKEAQVVLASSVQPDGSLVIEIRDTGVGMSATQRNAINERLAVPPMVDVSISRHMGLFVVGRLAARHGIIVRMRATADAGGLTAVISVPSGLLTPDPTRAAAPAPSAQVGADNGSSSPAKTGSLWDAARNVPLVPAAPPNLAPAETRNGSPVPTGNGSLSSAPGSNPLFAVAAASTLNPSGNGPAGTEPTQDLFTATVPSDGQSTDFFPSPSPGKTFSPEPGEATPIFQEMRSAWFRQWPGVLGTDQPDSGAGHAPGPEPELASDFGSAADEGWQAVEQLRTPVEAGITTAGLPRRRPRANLVPGATSRSSADYVPAAGRVNNVTPLRDAERVRGNLSSYQRGTRRGRHSSPIEDSERSGSAQTRNGMGRHGELPSSQERQ